MYLTGLFSMQWSQYQFLPAVVHRLDWLPALFLLGLKWKWNIQKDIYYSFLYVVNYQLRIRSWWLNTWKI